jgi:hypothetical protein
MRRSQLLDGCGYRRGRGRVAGSDNGVASDEGGIVRWSTRYSSVTTASVN